MLSIIQIPQDSSHDLTVNDDHALSPIGEIESAFRAENWLALLLGGLIGSFIPIASWTIIGEIVRGGDWRLWFLAGGGMTFSVLSVAKWANTAFGGGAGTTLASAMKAAGFCALLDGSMAFSHVRELSLAALALLVIVNTICCTTSLQPSRTRECETSPPAVMPSVVVNVAQQNVTTPRQRTAQASRSDAQRREGDARRSREYRARKRHEMASQTVTPEDK